MHSRLRDSPPRSNRRVSQCRTFYRSLKGKRTLSGRQFEWPNGRFSDRSRSYPNPVCGKTPSGSSDPTHREIEAAFWVGLVHQWPCFASWPLRERFDPSGGLGWFCPALPVEQGRHWCSEWMQSPGSDSRRGMTPSSQPRQIPTRGQFSWLLRRPRLGCRGVWALLQQIGRSVPIARCQECCDTKSDMRRKVTGP